MAMGSTLVLGGGGQAGIAWITGLLAGLAEAGQDVTGADLVIGTSAGATVAAQLGSGLGLDELFARQVEPALQSREVMVELDLAKFGAEIQAYMARAVSPEDTLRQFGRFALDAQTVPEAERRAVPGVWPPVTIDGRRYMDGGVRSPDNADLAAGAERITVISPSGMDTALPTLLSLREAVAALSAGGASVTVVSPDKASLAAFGTNALDPATRIPAATAGRAQGRAGLPPAL